MTEWTTRVSMQDDLIVGDVHEQGRKQWIAHLEDTDNEFRFERAFLCYSDEGDSSDSGHETLEDGMVIEVADGDSRLYWQVDRECNDLLRMIDADAAEARLRESD